MPTKDVYGQALSDYFAQQTVLEPLYLHNSYGEKEEMPIEVFFREAEDSSELEDIALALCDGEVLDVGAGAGAHSLLLQERGMQVYALEISGIACDIMQQRGVKNIIQADFWTYSEQRYDTLLFLMNGIGISGNLDGFRKLLSHAENILNPGGQLIFDSSDINYLYEEYEVPRPSHYYGEVQYRYEYRGSMGDTFPWLYIDQQTLIQIAQELGWVVQILFEDENDQYLVRLERRVAQDD